MKTVEPKYLGVDGAEARSGVSRWTWRRMAYDGRIASSKVGKRLLIPTAEVDRVLAEGYRPAISSENRAR
jgi:excisionase family DNA binding protein